MSGGTAGGRIAPGVGANLIGQHAQDRNQDATVYVGNLDIQLTEELLWELFTQAGPVDRLTNQHQGYGFVEFRSEEDADYSIKVLNMIKVHGKPIRVNKSSQDKRNQDIGANLFIGNLDPDVDEKLLYDTFSAFGMIISTPKIMRDPETGLSKGFGFVSYETFEASDAAIEAMHNQFLMNRSITVSYAFKKDSKGERHGTPAERLLASQMRQRATIQSRPNTIFAAGPKQTQAANFAPASMLNSVDIPIPPAAYSQVVAAQPNWPPPPPIQPPQGVTLASNAPPFATSLSSNNTQAVPHWAASAPPPPIPPPSWNPPVSTSGYPAAGKNPWN